MVLGTAERLHPLAGSGCLLIDVPGHRGGPDEGDAGYAGMGQESVDGILPAVHQVQDARRYPCLMRQLDDPGRRERYLLARLEDEGVARGDGVGPEPERHHGGKVERRDRREHTEWLPDVFAIDTSSDVLERSAHHEGGNAAGMLDVLDATPDGAARLAQDLAVLAGHRSRQLFEMLFQEGLEAEEVAGPYNGWDLTPGEKCVLGRGHRLVDVACRRERYLPERVPGGGVGDVEVLGGLGADPLAADVVPECRRLGGCHGSIWKREGPVASGSRRPVLHKVRLTGKVVNLLQEKRLSPTSRVPFRARYGTPNLTLPECTLRPGRPPRSS